ncbi:MAG TPA: hypothetical protein VFV76_14385 [Actinomycetes bacterium]|nr:hypothetical protein [Actinomycetes bacterium]
MAYAQPDPVSDEKALARANDDLARKDRRSRQEAAVALRIAGATYSDIARMLEYASPSLARQAVERSLASTAGPESRDQLRFIEARRLERLLRGLWHKATDEKNDEHLAAVRTAIAVIDRHARLYGLDAPQEMVLYTPAANELDAWVAKMAKQVRGELPQETDIVSAEYQIVDEGTGDDG